MEIILTQHGRKLLNKGKLIVKHYKFFDDEVDYQASPGDEYTTTPGAVTPLTIFPDSNLLWIDAQSGSYLRDSGGAAPDNGEIVSTLIDRGNVGDCVSAGGSGLTYDATAFGSRGGLVFAGGASDLFTSPSWVLNSRCSGIIVWRTTSGGARAAWGHAATNTHTSVFWNANLVVARRIDGAGGLDTSHVQAAATNTWSSWRLQNSGGESWGPAGISGSSAVAGVIPASSATTKIGALNAGVAPYIGTIGEIVLVDKLMTEGERAALQAYIVARWGLTA